MNNSQVVKAQFNQHAPLFDKWTVTKDEQHARYLLEMAGVQSTDAVMDVACGTGALANLAATKAKTVVGVDISENMIAHAEKQALQLGLKNISFRCTDVSELPFDSDTFDFVGSKSAFHHMPLYRDVLKEMARCTRPGGKVGLQDIVAYDDSYVDNFFETLELLVDESHHKTYSKSELAEGFRNAGLTVTRAFDSISPLDLEDYIGHAVQKTENSAKIREWIEKGKNDTAIQPWLEQKNDRWIWKRRVVTMLGKKEGVK